MTIKREEKEKTFERNIQKKKMWTNFFFVKETQKKSCFDSPQQKAKVCLCLQESQKQIYPSLAKNKAVACQHDRRKALLLQANNENNKCGS